MFEEAIRESYGVRTRALRWARGEVFVWALETDDKLLAELLRAVAVGRFRVLEGDLLPSPSPSPRSSPDEPREHAVPSKPSAPMSANDIVDDPRSLMITHCPPLFDPRDGALRVACLLRGLHGQAVEFVVRSQTQPEPALFRRMLSVAETTDGAHTLEWDGKLAGSGVLVKYGEAPLIIELVHDARYRDRANTTLPPPWQVTIVEMEDLMFATGRCIVMPDGGFDVDADDPHERATGLHAIAATLRFAAFHRDKRLCIFGHTDTVGSEDDNMQLSRERATNVLSLLRGDVDGWAAHCEQHYEVADFQRVLKWLAVTKGWPTDPGAIDNDFGNATRTARNNFRARMNAEYGTALKQGVKQAVGDWKAYFTLFDEELARILGASEVDLARIRGKLQFTDPAALGCGEAFPADAPGINNLESTTNRRVDLVFFDPSELPDLAAEPAGVGLYGTTDYVAEYLPIDKGGSTRQVILRLLHRDKWLGGTEYRIELDGQLIASGTTTADGWVEAELPKSSGLYLHVPDVGRSFEIAVAPLDPLPALAGVQGRLANLGYLCPNSGELDDETREALTAFQSDHALPATGEADGETIAVLRELHDEI